VPKIPNTLPGNQAGQGSQTFPGQQTGQGSQTFPGQPGQPGQGSQTFPGQRGQQTGQPGQQTGQGSQTFPGQPGQPGQQTGQGSQNLPGSQTLPGGSQTLTRAEYLADTNFLNIDAKMRREQNLQGFDIVQVSRQVVAGSVYTVVYRNQLGSIATFKVFVDLRGEIVLQ
jgi:hypothetical protein